MGKVWVRGTAGVGGIAILLACSGLPVPLPIGVRYDNVSACQGYVSTYNALACVQEQGHLSADDFCPKALDWYGCDLAEHYTCMSTIQCSDGLPDATKVNACGERSCD